MAPAFDVFVHHEGDKFGLGRDTPLKETMKRLERASLAHPDHIAIDYSFAASDSWKAEARGWLKAGSHTLNHNRTSHGICVPGNYTLYDPRPALLTRIAELIVEGVRRGAILQPFRVRPHSDVFGTACPGRLKAHLPGIAQLARDMLGLPVVVPPVTPAPDTRPTFNVSDLEVVELGIEQPNKTKDATRPAVAWPDVAGKVIVLVNGASVMNDRDTGLGFRTIAFPTGGQFVTATLRHADGGGFTVVDNRGHGFSYRWS